MTGHNGSSSMPSAKRRRSESPDHSGSDTSPRLESKSDANGLIVKDKKQKACLNCRRSKLKCVLGPEGVSCLRCSARKEECRFKTRAHDDEWQEATSSRIESLTKAVEALSSSVQSIMKHLDLNTSAPLPMTSHSASTPSVPAQSTPVTPAPWLSPPTSEAAPVPPAATSSMSYSLDHNNVDGAEALMAQTETSPEDYTHLASGASGPGAGASPPRAGIYNLLDDLINNGPVAASAAPLLKPGESLGESDPRADVIKKGVVGSSDANVLVDHFHAHLANHLFGFPLQIGAWPYLPEGKPTMTPLILGVACLVPAERLPHYHHLFEYLMTALNDDIFNAKPGYSNAVDGNRQPSTSDPDAEASTLDAPDLDLELGIGPEEISALCAAATFTCSEKSDQMARTVFEWTRGYLKTFKNPPPHPLTLGEVCGLLPPRRNLTFENWLRLWLFAYIVYAQQALHRNRRAPVFDPRPFCTLLFENLSTIAPMEQARDLQLISHARLCAIFQRVQHAQGVAGWKYGTTENVIAAFDGWNTEINQWKTEVDRFEMPSDAKMFLTCFGLFALVYVNQGGLEDPALTENPKRWRYGTEAARAAHHMLEIAQIEPFFTSLPVFPPIYIQMVTLSAAVLLKSLRHSQIVLPSFHAKICEMVEHVANILHSDVVPAGHVSRSASVALHQAVARVRSMPSSMSS